MKIENNWFYIVDEKSAEKIEIWEWIYAFVFLRDVEKSFRFDLKKSSRLDLFGFSMKKSGENLEFVQSDEKSELKIKYMFFNSETDLTSNIKSTIASNNSKSNINIISIIKDKKLHIDSTIEIEKWFSWIEANLKQKNIFIWDKWQVRGLPKLLVKSNQVKASHACKVERISDDLLFYLKSRWISENKAILLMIESYFVKNFSCLKMMDKKNYEKVYNDFLTLNK